MVFINRCRAKLPDGSLCLSEAHDKLPTPQGDVPLCSHHIRFAIVRLMDKLPFEYSKASLSGAEYV